MTRNPARSTRADGSSIEMRDDSSRPTEEDIRRFVARFYEAVREDTELGPIFEARIGSAWDAHLERMVDFWSTVLLASGRYRGNPLETHRTIAGLESRIFADLGPTLAPDGSIESGKVSASPQ